MRDGIELHALLDVLERGTDDAGNGLPVDDDTLQTLRQNFEPLWADNPVQWYLSYHQYRTAREAVFDAMPW